MTDRIDEALQGVDPSRRSFLRKVVVTTAFTAPVVASFAMDGMVVSKAMAQRGGELIDSSNVSGGGGGG